MMTTDNSDLRPAFHMLLDLHGRELHAYLWRMLGNRQDAEDCLQDTFLRAFRAFERTDADWNYRAWLYKIATNVARTHMKRDRRQDAPLVNEADPNQLNPLETIALKEQVSKVMSEMERLSFRQRTAIMMRKYSDLDYDVIAEVLGCTPETARAHVYQGLKRLRERMQSALIAEGRNHA